MDVYISDWTFHTHLLVLLIPCVDAFIYTHVSNQIVKTHLHRLQPLPSSTTNEECDEFSDGASSFVDISFDSASNVVTLIFDGNTDYPVRASADAMMNDQGISEVHAKDNSIPRGKNMITLVVNTKMVGGSIKFDGQIFRINSSKNGKRQWRDSKKTRLFKLILHHTHLYFLFSLNLW